MERRLLDPPFMIFLIDKSTIAIYNFLKPKQQKPFQFQSTEILEMICITDSAETILISTPNTIIEQVGRS